MQAVYNGPSAGTRFPLQKNLDQYPVNLSLPDLSYSNLKSRAEPRAVVCFYLCCNHLTTDSSKCKDHIDKSSANALAGVAKEHQYLQGEKSRIVIFFV